MAQWKRVYVPGKGYRWTDGKGNYKTNNPAFRNPANAAVDAGASAAKSTAKSAVSTASKSASATAQAASRTAEKERDASSNAIGYGAKKKAEKDKAPKVKADANGRSSRGIRTDNGNTVATGSQQYNNYRNRQIAEERERLKGVGNPPKPKPPAPRPAGTQPSRPAATRPATPAAPKKPAAPASPKDRRVSASTANRESGNYGTSRTNNPMIDDAMKARMRQREERDGVGPVKDGARYAADVKSNTQGVGPVKDGNRYASNLKPSTSTPGKKKEDETKTMSLAERIRRRRQGLI